jgi:hypothetical protein
MIQYVKFVGQSNAGLFQVLERPHDVAVFHVPLTIVIGADNKDTGMTAPTTSEPRTQRSGVSGCSCRLLRCAACAAQKESAAQPGDQRFLGRIVIEIEVHASEGGFFGA